MHSVVLLSAVLCGITHLGICLAGKSRLLRPRCQELPP